MDGRADGCRPWPGSCACRRRSSVPCRDAPPARGRAKFDLLRAGLLGHEHNSPGDGAEVLVLLASELHDDRVIAITHVIRYRKRELRDPLFVCGRRAEPL